jgi:hypothetical protein
MSEPVTVKYLFIVALILAAGVVEAGETWKPGFKYSPDGCNTCVVGPDGRTASCTDVFCPITSIDEFLNEPATCEQRMRDAMTAMNSFVPRIYDKESSVIEGWMKNEHTSEEIIAARKQWDQTYKDCVHGARP